jgi:cysteinyl-tRNA synthetase
MIKLFNTLGRKLEDFKPISDSQVTLYTCGPTVYDYQHIGNFRKFVFDDTLRRTLQASELEVKHVMNITDVGHLVSDADEGDDKLEKGAAREGKTVWEVAEHYAKAFTNDSAQLNILKPNGYHSEKGNYARATDFIEQQVDLVQKLLDNNFAYLTERAIYFDVTKLSDYGELSGQKLSEKEVGVREDVVTDNNKKNPQDFALWFFLKGRYINHTMRWSSPWGEGFPGWALECSAIIHKTLGDPIDIHTGGVDHIGTHHPNEIAQTEAAYGHKLANYWLHSEHLLVDGQKMSKSLGNFYTLSDVIDKGFDPMALRLFYLQGHYRTQINFTWENLEAAQNRLKDLRSWADLRHQPSADTMPDELDELFRDTRREMLNAMQNDLSTPQALTALSKLVSFMQSIPIPGVEGKYTDGTLKLIDDLLGLDLANRADINTEQKHLISRREEARKVQDWHRSDELRNELKEQGIDINDTAHGPVWSRI